MTMTERVKVFNDVAKINLHEYVSSLMGRYSMNDITLACPEGELKANKSILISNCKVIKDVLRFHPSTEQPYIFLADQTMRNMNLMLEFLYTGRANIRNNDSGDFFKLAENLQILGVTPQETRDEELTTKEESPIKFSREKPQVLTNSKEILQEFIVEPEIETTTSQNRTFNGERLDQGLATSKDSYVVRTHYINSLIKDHFSKIDKESSSVRDSSYILRCKHCVNNFKNIPDKL